MRIGIITTTFENIGSRLQNIATVELLKEQYPKSKIETIVLHSNHGKLINFFAKSSFFRLIFQRLKFKGKINKDNKLCHYKSYFIRDYSIESLKFLDNIYDLFVIGSDQIWNNLSDASNFYFGMFTKKKVCNSPSFIPEKCQDINKLKTLLSTFKNLNVREKATCDFIKNELGLQCSVLEDPTLRVKKEFWLKLAKKHFIKESNFPLVFILNNEALAHKINDEFKKNLLRPKLIYNINNGRQQYKLSPLEFIHYVSQCSELNTNSFHGACFAFIFEKKLSIYKQNNYADIRFDFFLDKKCLNKFIYVG